jgi:hypothetical protein
MRVDVTAVSALKDQYQLTIERVDLEYSFCTSKTSYFMNKRQLTQLAEYLTEVTNGLE